MTVHVSQMKYVWDTRTHGTVEGDLEVVVQVTSPIYADVLSFYVHIVEVKMTHTEGNICSHSHSDYDTAVFIL